MMPIVFQTDPENTDYALEDGATRNFEAAKTAELLATQEQKDKEEEERNNPMKVRMLLDTITEDCPTPRDQQYGSI